ncbi:sensor histidine kinase [Sphaerisporangium perillae]|uniref:sensor histidine kinase n=1 Tax=Sphaerisporangium perillae TaxID=2935860 RepID=UPI00200C9C7E|nr:sensor histidine kinase [Sphaerisporangium perillae]
MTRRLWTSIVLGGQAAMTAWLVVFFAGFGRVVPASGPEQAVPIGIGVAGFTGLVVVGVLLGRRQPAHPLAPFLIVPFMLSTAAFALTAWVLVAHAYGRPELDAVLWVAGWIWTAPVFGLIFLVFRFPTGRPAGRWWRRYEYLVVATMVLGTVLAAFSPSTSGAPAPLDLPNPLGIAALGGLDRLLNVLTGLYVVHAAVGLACMVTRYVRGDEVERQQLRWVAAAGALLITVTVADAYVTTWLPEAIAIVLLPVVIGVAVLRYRLWDLGLVIRRAVVYALLTGLLLLAYIGLVLVLRSLLPGLAPEILVTGLIAIVALPLRELLQTALDRILYGSRRDPYAVVRMLGHRLEAGAEPLLPMVVRELAEALRLPYVAIVLTDGGVVVAHGSRPAWEVEPMALHHGGKPVGEILAARRHPAESLTARDRELLGGLAGHLGVAVRAAALDEELRQSHARLLAAREEERTRIQRDLHDELGPLLGAASLRAEAARNLLSGQDRISDVLTALGTDLTRAMGEIRRILADLAPSPLDGQGLIAALRQHAASWTGGMNLGLDLPETLPPLDPPVEAAAYRIAVEALHNAQRHSSGSRVTLRLRLTGETLEVRVTDDGTGFPVQAEAGVGLRSMRTRAQQLGGSLVLESGERGGVVVHGLLPARAVTP